MPGIITVNMGNCLIQTVHGLYGKDIIQIFFSEILLRGRNRSRHTKQCPFVSFDLHVRLLKRFGKRRHDFFPYFFMYHKGFTGVAYPDTLGFGIQYNGDHLFHIREFIHVNMAVPCAGFNHRHRTVFHYGTDKAGTASGNQHIHIFI